VLLSSATQFPIGLTTICTVIFVGTTTAINNNNTSHPLAWTNGGLASAIIGSDVARMDCPVTTIILAATNGKTGSPPSRVNEFVV